MPSGPKKRKAAKKKQVKHSNNSNSSSTTHSHHGESDGGELSSPAAQDQHSHQLPFTKQDAVEVKNHEDSLSRNKSITVETAEKTENQEKGITEIDKGSKSRKSHDSSSSSSNQGSDDESHVFEKKVVELVQPIEPLPEKIAQEVEGSAMETNPFLDPVKPADCVLEEVNDDIKIENPNIVLEKMILELDKSSFVEQTIVVNESGSKDNCSNSSVVVESVMVENGAAKLPSQEEIVSSESQDNVAASTDDGADRINEAETLQYSDKQPLVASAPQAVQTTSWKSCCGILELFSSSDRN